MEKLTLTSARKRFVRGEVQYNKVSRFIKEIPVQVLESEKTIEYEKLKPTQNFGVKSSDGLDYEVGDRVKHLKFGEGLVTAIVEGGRDYEVTVQFDVAGTKKMFAGFAKLQKI